MKIQGIIAEYNPFHNGHKYHIDTGKKLSSATHTIVVMSGNFVQRGEPAIFDKFLRAKMAIKEGADLVIELPTVFSLGSAEYFGHGAVSLLNSLAIVDVLSFGCEDDNMSPLQKIATILYDEPDEYKSILKSHLDKGLSFPKAREHALSEFAFAGKNVEEYFKPNNILGIEYIKSLKKLKSTIEINPVKRTGVSYYSSDIKNGIASATKIRKLLIEGNIEKVKEAVPEEIFSIVRDSINDNSYSTLDDLREIIYSNLLLSNKENLKMINDISEGIENRLLSSIDPKLSIDHYLDKISSKRYTRTRLQRILIKSLLNLTDDYYKDSTKNHTHPLYARILGFNSKGREILAELKKSSQIPIITNINKFDRQLLEDQGKMLDMDIKASNLYSLMQKKSLYRDLTEKVYMEL